MPTRKKKEDCLDAQDFRAAKKQWKRSGKKTVSWDKLKSEIYTAERRAEFLLSNAVDAADYRSARAEVKKLGLNPSTIPHCKPCKNQP